jgi:hypothetical protein
MPRPRLLGKQAKRLPRQNYNATLRRNFFWGYILDISLYGSHVN